MSKIKNLEDGFSKLDEVILLLEQEEVSLEDSFKHYNEGMQLLKACNESLDKIEKQMIELQVGEDSNEL